MITLDANIVQNILNIFVYFGDIVFSVSGALAAGRRKMDIVGFVLIGTITGLGGGTLRDVLLGRAVWWTQDSFELLICIIAASCTFFWTNSFRVSKNAAAWFDALGLSAFAVAGSSIAMQVGTPVEVAVFMGVMTATGGGVIRDVLTDTRPMILCGELYAVAALAGAFINVCLVNISINSSIAMSAGFIGTFLMRGAAIIYDIRLGPPGEFVRMGKNDK